MRTPAEHILKVYTEPESDNSAARGGGLENLFAYAHTQYTARALELGVRARSAKQHVRTERASGQTILIDPTIGFWYARTDARRTVMRAAHI